MVVNSTLALSVLPTISVNRTFPISTITPNIEPKIPTIELTIPVNKFQVSTIPFNTLWSLSRYVPISLITSTTVATAETI
jgi:hypothetical protein